jgi:hypothetical protein
MTIKQIIFLAALVFFAQTINGSDYTLELRDPNARSKSVFRIRKSDGTVQNLSELCFDILSGWIATTTAKLMTTTAAAGCPNAALTAATGVALIAFPDAPTLAAAAVSTGAPLVFNLKVPVDYVKGCGVDLLVNAQAHQNVASPVFLLVRAAVNGATAAVASGTTTQITTTAYSQYRIPLNTLTGMSALEPGDDLAILISRAEKITKAATGTINIKAVNLVYNKSFSASW